MSDQDLTPGQLPTEVNILDRLEPGDLDRFEAISAAQDKTRKLRAVVKAFEDQQSQERPLRTYFAKALLGLVAAQVVALFVFAYLLGFGIIHVDQWVATTFLLGVLTQTGVFVQIIIKYLFPEKSQQILEIIEKL